MSRRRRAFRLVLVGAIAIVPMLGVSGITAQSASADADGPNFDALANAYGVDPTVTNPSLPLGLTLEAAGPAAQAHLNSIGNSDGLASFPYPGDTASGLPGTAGALFGVPIPAYPLYVTTQSGDAPKVTGTPGVTLSAASYRNLAIGRAVVGTDTAGFTSNAQVAVNQDLSVTATASTVLGVNLLGVLTLSGVESSASVTADSYTGARTRTSHLSIGEITVPGLAISVPAGTPSTIPIPIPVPGVPQLPPTNLPVLPLPLGGTTLSVFDLGFVDGSFTVTLPIPLGKPLTFAIPASLVLNAFKVLGINVTYQRAEQSSTGVIAPALTFTYDLPAPPANNYYQGKTSISFTVGRSTASVTLHPAVAALGGATGGIIGNGVSGGATGGITTGGPTSSGATGGVTGSPIVPGAGNVAPAAPIQPLNAAPQSALPTAGSGAVAPSAPQLPAENVALTARDLSQADLSGLYLLGIAIVGAVIAAASILRVIGVRLRWAF